MEISLSSRSLHLLLMIKTQKKISLYVIVHIHESNSAILVLIQSLLPNIQVCPLYITLLSVLAHMAQQVDLIWAFRNFIVWITEPNYDQAPNKCKQRWQKEEWRIVVG